MIQFEHMSGDMFLIGAALSAVVILVFAFKRKVKILHVLLRTAAIILLLGAFLGPRIEKSRDANHASLLLDISDSMDEGAADSLLNYVRNRYSDVDIEVIPFSGKVGTTPISLSSAGTYRALRQSWSKLDIGKTDIGAALSENSSRSGNTLLISDGFETAGDAAEAELNLQESGIRIFPIVPESASKDGETFRISQLYAPLIAPANKSVDVRVSVRNTTSSAQTGVLEVNHDGKKVYEQSITVPAGEEKVVIAQSDPQKEGIKEVTATLRPERNSFPRSSETIFLSGEMREKILLLSGFEEDERYLKRILSEESYQLTALTADNDKTSVPDLKDFSAVILNNIALAQLESGTPKRIQEFVQNGGGFIMAGGNRSFGLGGYKDTPIEEALPVVMLPPQTEKKRLNVAVELVMDKSRSMSFDNKIEFVKEASRQVVNSLKDEDYMGLIGFDASPFIVVRLGQLSQIRDMALDRISRIFASGKTNLLPAIDEARRALERVNAGRKHMIILTDGKLPDGGPYFVEIVKQLRLSGITVSTVMLGADSEDLLRDMAEAGGGAFYQTTDPNSLPRIFLNDIKVSSGEKTMKEKTEYFVRRGTGDLRSTTLQSYPSIRGYVSTKSKDAADLELVAFADQSAEPLLASWNYGKGRSIAFTSDANGRWSNQWIAWPKFRQFWSELVGWVQPREANNQDIRFDLRTSVEHGALNLDLAVFSGDVSSGVNAAIRLPDGTERTVQFSRESPGKYRAELPEAKAGKYEVKMKSGRNAFTPVAFSLSGELFGEQHGRGFNIPFLERIAGKTKGALNPKPEELKNNPEKKVEHKSLALYPLILATLLLILEIFLREVWRSRRIPMLSRAR